jgi:PPOX class probable F420-dependent enzyme
VSGLEDFARLVPGDHGLCVVSTLRPDGTIQSSVVNAGVLSHPVTGAPVVGLVSRGGTRKLANLRERPRATVVVRVGWDWAAAEGPVELAGPDDPMPGVDAELLRLLLREIFTAAGGSHDDWVAYDQVMVSERRTAVLVQPARISANRLREAIAGGVRVTQPAQPHTEVVKPVPDHACCHAARGTRRPVHARRPLGVEG